MLRDEFQGDTKSISKPNQFVLHSIPISVEMNSTAAHKIRKSIFWNPQTINIIHLPATTVKRQMNSLLKKLEAGKLNKVVIYRNGIQFAMLVSPKLISNPLENTRHDPREEKNDRSDIDPEKAFLDFLEKDIENNPSRLISIDKNLLAEIDRLTANVEIGDIDSILDDDE